MKALKINLKRLNSDQFEELKRQSRLSLLLYNEAINICDCYFKETGKYIGINELYNQIKKSENYTGMLAKAAQQLLRNLDKNYRSFFSLLRRKREGSYLENISAPKPIKGKHGMYHLILPNDQVILKNGILKLTKKIKIPFSYNGIKKVQQALIKWNGVNFIMYLTYDENLEINKTKNKIDKNENLEATRILSIDLGINNLMTIFSNVGPSFIVNGKPLKSYNQYYNKHIAKVKSQLKKVNNKYTSILTNRINENRNNYINDYLNKSVALIKKYCLENNIGRVIIGYNELWKQNVNMGKINNQKFVYIPHGRLRMKLEHKLVEAGIIVDMVEESYTSKCSFMDREKVCKHDDYVGKRVKRGLFKTENGIFINSDVNGAGNIMRKLIDEKNVFLEKQFDKIVGSIISPVRLNVI